MKTKTLTSIFCTAVLFVNCLQAQTTNVGIGKANPAEKLDVGGNLNVDGTIKVNGVDGTANQVLMKNAEGNLTWGSQVEFKNFYMFTWSGNGTVQNFTIPAGVTKVAVELWGGGGGGSAAGGGGGGGYALGIFQVDPGGVAAIIVGSQGNGSMGAGDGASGTESRFTYNGTLLGVSGGFGATSSYPGAGGALSTISSGLSHLAMRGQTGQKNFENYQQVSPTEFALYTKYGRGGVAYGQMQTGGEGGYTIQNITVGFTIKEVFGSQGFSWGEGGGGGKSYGYPGSTGRVIVRW